MVAMTLSMGVLELEAATRDADRLDAAVDIELGQDVHAVRGHAEEQPLVDGFAWPLFADDRLDTDPAQEHAKRRARRFHIPRSRHA